MITKTKWDILIAGGGLGGVAAAIRAASMGCSVLLIDENKWLGGQITSQGVSALDEHKAIDIFGGTALYYEFRDRIKQYYRNNYKLSEKGKKSKYFNLDAAIDTGGWRLNRLLVFELFITCSPLPLRQSVLRS